MGKVNVGFGSLLTASSLPGMKVQSHWITFGDTLDVKSIRVSGAVVGWGPASKPTAGGVKI